MLLASVANEVIAVSNAVRNFQIEGYDLLWSDSNVVATRIDRTKQDGGAGGDGNGVGVFLVAEVFKDTLRCVTYSIDELGLVTTGVSAIDVAKPHGLRATGWDGQTVDGHLYTYAANGGIWNARTRTTVSPPAGAFADYGEDWTAGVVTREQVWPPYVAGQSIIIASQTEQSPWRDGVQWTDLNADGRRFEAIHKAIQVCLEMDDGSIVRRRVRIRASEGFE